MHNCALRNKPLVVALVIISSVTETKPPEFELSDVVVLLYSGTDASYYTSLH
jgi:pyruvate kinase